MLPVMEVFYSIQGEGRYSGNPSVFIRFGGCNLRCPGFGMSYTNPKTNEVQYGCDSFYSVDPAFRNTWNIVNDYEQIVEMVENALPDFGKRSIVTPDIVITGGEPLLYWNNEQFQKLLAYYASRQHNITIETNASLNIDFVRNYQKEIQFSMSVKLSNSGEAEHKRINIETITKILESTDTSYLKFVVDANNIDKIDEEIMNILKEIPFYATVYLMPMGGKIEMLSKNSLATAELAKKRGFRYTDRLHIRMWNSQPGV